MKTLLLACAAIAAAAAAAAAQPAPALPPPPPSYGPDAEWLCLPGRVDDPCGAPLPTTALNPNGYGSVGRSSPAADPAVDCFYVYPTVSRDRALNGDIQAGPEERAAATAQFARFHEVCRTFAPIYRQVTLAGLIPAMTGQDVRPNFEIAYSDVRNAFRQFLASRNNGRPFVLIGHSQGTIHLQRLIRKEIEGQPIARNMVSALLIGYNTFVAPGRPVGGTFRSTPLCTSQHQTGCVVSYVSFRAEAPPPAGALFGRGDVADLHGPPPPGMAVACTNPATLGYGPAPLDSYFPVAASAQPGAEPVAWSSEGPPPTPFLRAEGLVTAECVNEGLLGYLAVRVNADPADPRTDRIPGDVYLLGRPAPGWGLHVADVPLAQGDLIRLVRMQSAAFRGERG